MPQPLSALPVNASALAPGAALPLARRLTAASPPYNTVTAIRNSAASLTSAQHNVGATGKQGGSVIDLHADAFAAWQEITQYYSFKTALSNIFSPSRAKEKYETLNKNIAVIYAEVLNKITGWPPQPCRELADIIHRHFKNDDPDFLRLKHTIRQLEARYPHKTPAELVNGPLRKRVADNARAAAHRREHSTFVFKTKTAPAVALFEWFLTTFSPALCAAKHNVDHTRALKSELEAIEAEISAQRKGLDALSPKQKRQATLDIRCLESWKSTLIAPEDAHARHQFWLAAEKRSDFMTRQEKSAAELRAERGYPGQPDSAKAAAPAPSDSSRQALLVTAPAVPIAQHLRFSGVTPKGLFAALTGVAALAGWAGWAGIRQLYRGAAPQPTSAVKSTPTWPVSPLLERSDDTLSALQRELDATLAAVVPSADGQLHVLSLSDRLRALQQQYGDSQAFIDAVRALFAQHGELDALNRLFAPAQTLAGSVHPRLRREAASPSPLASPLAAQLEIVKRLIAPSDQNAIDSENRYFTCWQDSLPQSEAFHWLRYAPLDRQKAFKRLLDQVASKQAALASTLKQVVEALPQRQTLTQRLLTFPLGTAPEHIVLHANVTERAGSLTLPVPVSLTLDEAWQTGELEALLAAPDLSVESRSERLFLDTQQRNAFRAAFKGLTPMPTAAVLADNQQFQLAFYQLTDAQFELSTLEAELKGQLRSNDHIRGLAIVNKFRQGSPDVNAGTLTLRAQDATNAVFEVPLSGWLLLRDKDGCCVLYDADVNARSHVFPQESAMLQFVSENTLRQSVMTGRLEQSALAERNAQSWRAAEFFHALSQHPGTWFDRHASLHITPDDSPNFDRAIAAFSARLLTRNLALLAANHAPRAPALRAQHLSENWERVSADTHLTSLLGFTRQWIRSQPEYGLFLQEKRVISQAADFDPDQIFIKVSGREERGTITEFAAWKRRHEQETHDLAAVMELLPASVDENDYVRDLATQEKDAFASALRTAIRAQAPATLPSAHERYIASLTPAEQARLDKGLQLYRKLNQYTVKRGLDEAMKAGYPGSAYIAMLQQKLDFSQSQNRALRDAWHAAKIAKMQLALETERRPGMNSTLPVADRQRIQQLLAVYPASTTKDNDFLAPLTVSNIAVPDMVMCTIRDRLTPGERAPLNVRAYVYTPDALFGTHFFSLDDFRLLLQRSAQVRDMVTSRVALFDPKKAGSVFAPNKGSRYQVGYTLLAEGDFYTDMMTKLIAAADEQTVSRGEVIRDATILAAEILSVPFCLSGGPITNVLCAALTGVTVSNNIENAISAWRRNERDAALFSGLMATLGLLDLPFLGRAAKGVAHAAEPVSRGAKRFPEALQGVAGGAKGLLRANRKSAFRSTAEVSQALDAANRHASAFEAGWLKRGWAVNVDLGTAVRSTPHGKPAGEFFEQQGKWYIRERGYSGESPLVYQVKIDSSGTVRVINSHRPEVPGDKIVWNGQKWIKAQAGLKAGGKNTVGTFDPQFDGLYPVRDANNRPLYILDISESSVNSQSKKVYDSKTVQPFIDNPLMKSANRGDVKKLQAERGRIDDSLYQPERKARYDNNIVVRPIAAQDVPEHESALIGEFGGFAARDIKQGEIIGVYSGRIVDIRHADADEFLTHAFQRKAGPGDKTRTLRYSGDNAISRINTVYEADGARLRQAKTGYNAEAASFDITVAGYNPREPKLKLRLIALYATQDISRGKEFRWNYQYTPTEVQESLTH